MNTIKTPVKTIDEIRRVFRAMTRNSIIYTEMKRPGAVALIEFNDLQTFRCAQQILMKAFPERTFLTGIGEGGTHQIVINADDELVYFKMRESELLNDS